MAHLLCKIEITLSIKYISKEVHGRAARRAKTYGIPVKLRILPPDVGSENGPFRPDTYPFGVKVSSIWAMANRKITHWEDKSQHMVVRIGSTATDAGPFLLGTASAH